MSTPRDCDIDPDTLRCRVCGARVSSAAVRRNCGTGLGDLVAAGLAAVGITHERAQAVAEAIGLDDCGCDQRREALNELGRRIGLG